MVIPIVVGQEMTTTATGRVIKDVTCERCGTAYVHMLERAAKGKGSSLYFLDNRGAERRSAERAEKALVKRLEKEIDVVPCPECGCVQADMVTVARRKRLRWLYVVGMLLMIAAVVVGLMNWLTSLGDGPPMLFEWEDFWPYALIGPLVLLARFAMTRMYDPNADPEANRGIGQELALRREEFEQMVAEAEAAERDPDEEGGGGA